MLRRFNYTGRRKIPRDDVTIALVGTGPARNFDADLSHLSSQEFASDARVFVEAYERAAYMRFDFGTVGNISAPPFNARLLTEFEGSDVIRFRVKVVDPAKDAQLLGEADAILPLSQEESDQNKLPLLPVRSGDLKQELWQIAFPEGAESQPILVINESVEDRMAFVRSVPFMSLVLPAILRTILTRILIIEESGDGGDDNDWRDMWIQFGRTLNATAEAPPHNSEESQEWIEAVVRAFCNRRGLLTRFKENEEEANAITT